MKLRQFLGLPEWVTGALFVERVIFAVAAVLLLLALLVALTTPSVMDELAHRAIDAGVIP